MRLNGQQLYRITQCVRPSWQTRWFEKHFGVKLPSDQLGPIITEAAYEELVRRACGLAQAEPSRPTVHLRK